MRKNLLFISFYILCSLAVDAQTAVSDSLLKLLPAAKEDTSKVKLYIDIANEYENNEPETARQYYRKAIQLSKKVNDRNWYYKSLSRIGNTFLIQGIHHCQGIERFPEYRNFLI